MKQKHQMNDNGIGCFERLPVERQEPIEKYIDLLLEANRSINLVSRRITRDEIIRLVEETIILSRYIGTDTVVDAGSGNGILGIPLSILKRERRVILVESREKRADFLNRVKKKIDLRNVEIFNRDIYGYLRERKGEDITLIARGFPVDRLPVDFLKNGGLKAVVIITSENKIKKIKKEVENIRQKIYNIPYRDNLKILKMENVSRETRKRM